MSKRIFHPYTFCDECLDLDRKPCMQVCENFLVGFPCWWQSCNLRYPKPTSSRTGDGPCSYTSNSGADSTRFYLEKFQQGNHLHSCGTALISKLQDIFKSSSHNDASFKKSSHLSNGAPRFEEYTCDGDIATNENAAVSNDVIERHEIASGMCKGYFLEAAISFSPTNISFP